MLEIGQGMKAYLSMHGRSPPDRTLESNASGNPLNEISAVKSRPRRFPGGENLARDEIILTAQDEIYRRRISAREDFPPVKISR